MVQPAGKIYAQVNTGILKNPDKESYGNTGVTLGARGTLIFGQGNEAVYGQAEVGAGTAMSAKATLGYERNLGKGLGLDVSANASVDHSRTKTNNMFAEQRYTNTTYDENGRPTQVTGNNVFCTTWNPGQVKFSGKATVKKDTSWGSFGAGIEAGYRMSTAPEISAHQKMDYTNPVTQQRETMTSDYTRKPASGMFVTPTAFANVNIKGGLQAIGSVDLNEAKVGLRYTF